MPSHHVVQLLVDVLVAVPQKLYLFLQYKFCRSFCMVFYIHIHRCLDVFACPLDVQVDFLLSGMVPWLMKYHIVCRFG